MSCDIKKYYYDLTDSVFDLSRRQKDAFGKGLGQELYPRCVRGKNRPPKMCAVSSSSALAVNMFGPFAETCHHADFWNSLFKLGRFLVSDTQWGSFEKKLKVAGVSGFTPNLDFCIEGDDRIVGVESKYREVYAAHKKQVVQDQYFEKFRRWDEYPGLESTARSVGSYTCLGAAQLVKHALSLISTNKYFRLIYIYHPIEVERVHIKHEEELFRFKTECGLGRHFMAMTYGEYWKRLLHFSENLPDGYVEFIKKRYPKIAGQ